MVYLSLQKTYKIFCVGFRPEHLLSYFRIIVKIYLSSCIWVCAHTPQGRYKASGTYSEWNRDWIPDYPIDKFAFIASKAPTEDISNFECFSATLELHLYLLPV